ncbi:MAG TPA: lytic transglycosylase domain-containing protein [Thermoanaerobaculia bacterium]|nr:lytic transglycosylase domain-containing protein [Thermoanaerobaculia bacterium]
MARTRGVVFVCTLAALLPAFASSPARGEVKTRVRPDGTIEIYNDGPGGPLATRTLRLRPIPVAAWSDWIHEHADRHGVDPRLVQAIVQVESGYNHRARSRTGAVGLMQLMPETARTLQVGDRYDAEENIKGGVAYLRQMIDLFPGRLELAIAAYNAGPNAVQRHGGIPPYAETRDYVDRVLTLYRGTGSSLNVAFSSGGNALQLNGLVQALVPSPLQRALANGTIRPAARPVPNDPLPTGLQVAAAAPAPIPAEPIAAYAPAAPAPAPIVPVAAPAMRPLPANVVVPASLPIESAPALAQPATGG